MIHIKQSGDGLWKWRLHNTTWEGGYRTYGDARRAADAALRGERYAVAIAGVLRG